MRITKKHGLSARAYHDIADVSTSSIRMDLTEETHPIVRATFRLRAADARDRRALLVDFSQCPLVPLEITGSVIGHVQLSKSVARDIIMLNLREDSLDSWDESELTVTMRWSETMSRPPLLDRKFLYASDELPTIGARAGSASTLLRHIPVAVDPRNDRSLVGAISSNLDGSFRGDGFQLQAVLCTKLHVWRFEEAGGRVEISILTTSRAGEGQDSMKSICSQIQEMASYFGERLDSNPGLRIAVALDSKEDSRAMFGALLTAPKSWYRSKDRNSPSREFPLARMVANIWWGAGCCVSGERGVHLASGIAFALGLAWSRSFTSAAYFDRQISYFREHLIADESSRSSDLRPGERTVPIGLAIFDGLVAYDSVWNCLSRLTRDYWGREAPEEVVLGVLQSAGVEVLDFKRKRFVAS